jgi:bacillolysin
MIDHLFVVNISIAFFTGALNEAMSDIFGALLDQFIGKSEVDIWQIGEDFWTPPVAGDAIRYMCDPANDKKDGQEESRDFYPDRYQGTGDNGGVHINSGIANLGEFIL